MEQNANCASREALRNLSVPSAVLPSNSVLKNLADVPPPRSPRRKAKGEPVPISHRDCPVLGRDDEVALTYRAATTRAWHTAQDGNDRNGADVAPWLSLTQRHVTGLTRSANPQTHSAARFTAQSPRAPFYSCFL